MSDPSFAKKQGLNKPSKIQKNTVKPVAQQTVFPLLCLRSYKITAENEGQLKQLEKTIEAALQTAVGHSSIIRGLIQLAATNGKVRDQLIAMIPLENIHGGRPRSKP